MGIKESIANLRKALRTTQTNAPAVIDTLIRGLDGVETAAEEENTYSTDERIVGTWIDGSEIYQKVINVGTLPANQGKTINLSELNIETIINVYGYGKDTTYIIPIQYAYSNREVFTGIGIYYNRYNRDLVIETFSDRTSFTESYIIITYTKSTTSRIRQALQ